MNDCENPVIETVVNNTIVVTEDDCSVITTNTDSPTNIISELIPGPPGADGNPIISADADNRIELGGDGGLYVLNNLVPDPLAYYILSRS